jgi:rod shape-determining protein MreD
LKIKSGSLSIILYRALYDMCISIIIYRLVFKLSETKIMKKEWRF